jgi:glycosyltransferase involved in cell wall biosynthesis
MTRPRPDRVAMRHKERNSAEAPSPSSPGPPAIDRRKWAIVVPALQGGGAERVACTLATGLSRADSVTVITYKGTMVAPAESTLWQHIHITTAGRGPVRAVGLALKLARIIRGGAFDGVLGVLTYTNLVLYVITLFWPGHPPFVATEHTPISTLVRLGGISDRLQRALLPLAYRRLKLVVVSEAIAEDSRRSRDLRRVPITVIPNPVDIQEVVRLSQLRKAHMSVDTGVVQIVCVARLHEQKGLPVLLASLTMLPADFHLTLVGDGPMRKTLEHTVKTSALDGRVTFLGYLDNPYPEMRSADVIVLPSLSEGFGVAALEAAALGRIFIGSACDGLQDLCTELGYVTVSPGDAPSLRDAILSWRSNGCRSRTVPCDYELSTVSAQYRAVLLGSQ